MTNKPRIRKWRSLWECEGRGYTTYGYTVEDVYAKWVKMCLYLGLKDDKAPADKAP